MRGIDHQHNRLLTAVFCATLIVARWSSLLPPRRKRSQPTTPPSWRSNCKTRSRRSSASRSRTTFERGLTQRSRGFRFTLNFQPVIPISITENWDVISRTIVPIIHQDDVVGDSTQGGLADTVQTLFFSPKAPEEPSGIIWGAGPVFLLPTSTQDCLGAQKFGFGPTFVALRQHFGWTYGLLANHLNSFGGTSSTADVNATFLQPFLSYTTKTYTTIGIQTESTYDWEATKWTVPLIAYVSQLLKVAGHPISLQVGPKLYVEGPTGAPDWGIRFAFIFLFPK